MRLIEALRNPRAPTVSERPYRGMADFALYATCGKRGAAQRHHWARDTSTLRPRHFEEEELQLDEQAKEN